MQARALLRGRGFGLRPVVLRLVLVLGSNGRLVLTAIFGRSVGPLGVVVDARRDNARVTGNLSDVLETNRSI